MSVFLLSPIVSSVTPCAVNWGFRDEAEPIKPGANEAVTGTIEGSRTHVLKPK